MATPNGKPTLLHLNFSQSQQILWLLEELGIEYNLKFFERVNQRAPASLKETHPLGKSPQLITPEGRVIAERTAIGKYLISKYDTSNNFKINPNDPVNDTIREDELLAFGGASLNPILMVQLIFSLMAANTPFLAKPVVNLMVAGINKQFLNTEVGMMMTYLDKCFEGKDFAMGTKNPTQVDFNFLWYIDFAIMAGVDLAKYPNATAFSERCKARPAWIRSIEKGNGYKVGPVKL